MPRTLRDRAFQAWWRIQRPMTLGVRGLVRDSGGGVLLVKHTYTPGWHFPGGGVEKGETALLSLARELEEEAGVRPVTQPTLLGVFANARNFPNDHVLLFEINSWMETPATARGEIVERRFFTLDALPEGVTAGTQRRLDEIAGRMARSEEW
jgi:8-oxo-dGTP pyrophosphatase MutT (NUDIX family)